MVNDINNSSKLNWLTETIANKDGNKADISKSDLTKGAVKIHVGGKWKNVNLKTLLKTADTIVNIGTISPKELADRLQLLANGYSKTGGLSLKMKVNGRELYFKIKPEVRTVNEIKSAKEPSDVAGENDIRQLPDPRELDDIDMELDLDTDDPSLYPGASSSPKPSEPKQVSGKRSFKKSHPRIQLNLRTGWDRKAHNKK